MQVYMNSGNAQLATMDLLDTDFLHRLSAPLEALLCGKHVPIPGHQSFSVAGHQKHGIFEATVYDDGHPALPIGTLGAAYEVTDDAAQFWAFLHKAPRIKTEPTAPYLLPWIALRVEDGAHLHVGSLGWLTHFEIHLGGTWLLSRHRALMASSA